MTKTGSLTAPQSQPTPQPTSDTIKPFEPGGRADLVLAPHDTWSFVLPGVHFEAPEGAAFSVMPHPVDQDVYLVRFLDPTLRFPFGGGVAVPDSSYTFAAYGDGTARFAGLSVTAGQVLYFPGQQFGDVDALFNFDNAGFWTVERARAPEAFLRRLGSGSAGVSETIKAVNADDIQVGLRQEATALVMGVCSGVWPVVAACSRWVAIQVPVSVPELPEVVFDRFHVAGQPIVQLRVETDQLAALRLNHATAPVLLRPDQPGVEGDSMSKFEVSGFITGISVENCSGQPMKLCALYRTRK